MTATTETRTRAARAGLLFATFVCAACGLVYELALVAQGSYLLGDSITQASVVLATMVFAMGLGALTAKPLQRRPLLSLAVVEALLALFGGLSVLGLHAAFTWLDLYWPALIGIALVVGALIGAEIPLLMTLLQRIRKQDAGSAAADLFAADYVGALLGGLAFPFLLLPLLGQTRGALLVGMVNAVAGAAVALFLFSVLARRRLALAAGTVVVLAVLGFAFASSDAFLRYARDELYEDPVVYSETTQYQEIVVTESAPVVPGPTDTRLFLNGDLQFSSIDEYRYHESLVHPALAGTRDRVLVLGGGDGLALREVLRYPDVREVVEVELDPAMLRLAREHPRISALNERSLDDPRVTVVTADAFAWLRDARERFDAVVIDMPDPDSTATAKLYSTEFYSLARRVMAPGARLVVQAGSPYFAPRTFDCIDATVRSAGFATTPYHVNVPTFGDWGFTLAQASAAPPRLRLDPPTPLRFLDEANLAAAAVFPMDRRPAGTETPSTLDNLKVLRRLDALDVNFLASVRLDSLVVPGMRERGSGVIVHISSAVVLAPMPVLLHYAAAKAALETYSRGLAVDLVSTGIRVNVVAPGDVSTPGADVVRAAIGIPDGAANAPIGRGGRPDDIANMVSLLVSDRGEWVTGRKFVIDGGAWPRG
ncbi:MAG: polyamine aminopropyltransferase [Pseudonocardiaceae bacterium]|nr:polyamine aminopropyltransferase [Pseudonocardiaceae bacterium]